MKNWRRSDKLTFWGIVVAAVLSLLALLFGDNLLGKFSASANEPQFQYIYEGAFDQNKPEYEVAFPLGWGADTESNAHIRVRADYGGDQYAGITYIKIRQADGTVTTVGQWNDFSTESERQQDIPLKFSDLFEYSGIPRNIANFDVSNGKPELVSGQFTIYVENAGQVIPGSEQTITVYNTPWLHRTYLDTYEMDPGDKVKAYVEVINFGAESDFSISTCPYRIVTPSYQVDPVQVTDYEDQGFWPTRPGNLQSVCGDELHTPLHLGAGEKKIVPIDLHEDATAEQGYYDYIVFVVKKLPVIDYGSLAWEADWHSRDGRQHATYIVIGE